MAISSKDASSLRSLQHPDAPARTFNATKTMTKDERAIVQLAGFIAGVIALITIGNWMLL